MIGICLCVITERTFTVLSMNGISTVSLPAQQERRPFQCAATGISQSLLNRLNQWHPSLRDNRDVGDLLDELQL